MIWLKIAIFCLPAASRTPNTGGNGISKAGRPWEMQEYQGDSLDAFLDQAEEIRSCSHCTATEANVRKRMPSPETATKTASCVISYIGIGEVWQVPMESRPWRRLSSVPRTQVSRSLLHGPLKLNLWAHLLQMPHFMPHLPPWESRVNQDRSGLTLLQQNSGFAQIYLFSSVENKTETKCGISFMDTSWTNPPMQGLPLHYPQGKAGQRWRGDRGSCQAL